MTKIEIALRYKCPEAEHYSDYTSIVSGTFISASHILTVAHILNPFTTLCRKPNEPSKPKEPKQKKKGMVIVDLKDFEEMSIPIRPANVKINHETAGVFSVKTLSTHSLYSQVPASEGQTCYDIAIIEVILFLSILALTAVQFNILKLR